jgi:hypothetical protein
MAVRLLASRTGLALLPRNIFLLEVLISVRGFEAFAAGRIRYIEKNSLTPYEIEPAAFRLTA